jgi:hypothetical protein
VAEENRKKNLNQDRRLEGPKFEPGLIASKSVTVRPEGLRNNMETTDRVRRSPG